MTETERRGENRSGKSKKRSGRWKGREGESNTAQPQDKNETLTGYA